MKILGSSLLILLISALGGTAQELKLVVLSEKTEFLTGEAIPISARLINHSGQMLHLGATPDWLSFNVDGQNSMVIPKLGDVPVGSKEFELDSEKMATKTVDLQPYFNLSKPGRYFITASAAIPAWGATVSSKPSFIDVFSGIRLWEQQFGVPPLSTAAPGPPEVRKYILEKVAYKDSMKLYLRLTDSTESRVFKVFPVGIMNSFSKIDARLDKSSNLHLIYQAGSWSFLYSMMDPGGELIIRQTHDSATASSRPRLAVDDDGKVSVVGGTRHLTDADIPPSSGLLPADAPTPTAKP